MRTLIYRYRRILLLAALFPLCGCVKNEINVEFQLPANVNDAYKMTYYASDPVKGWFVETVAAVQQGKAKLTLATRNPTIVFIMDAGSMPKAAFYAERGDKIKITGDGNNPLSWNIKGNKLTEEWSDWRAEARSALSSADPVKINRAVGDYIRREPEKPLSTILLLVYYDRRVDEAGFSKLWGTLKGKALEPKWIQLVSRSDMLGDSPSFPQTVKNMILHSFGNGVDTLSFAGKPSILFFWRNEDERRDEGMKMMGDVSRDFPDSASRIIADVCFDPDSIGWHSKVPKDSLSKVVRGWNFRAETDSVMMRLGVNRTPWFVVMDKKGQQRYAGENPAEADSVFRKISK